MNLLKITLLQLFAIACALAMSTSLKPANATLMPPAMPPVTYSLPASLVDAAFDVLGTLPAELKSSCGLSVRRLLDLIERVRVSQDAARLSLHRLLDPHEMCTDNAQPCPSRT